MGGSPPALRRHRRRRHERARAGRARSSAPAVTGSDRSGGSSYAARLCEDGHRADRRPRRRQRARRRRGRLLDAPSPPENPERAGAERELHRADLLGELTRLRPTIAVSGTHGKTTTSSMLVHALRGSGLDPSYLVGGEVRSTGSNAGWGTGEWLVVEADESDRSLLKLDRRVAVLTNAELDHHATYSSRRDVEATFREFLAAARARGGVGPAGAGGAGRRRRACGRSTADAGAVAGRLDRSRSTASRWSCPSPAPTTRSTPPPR